MKKEIKRILINRFIVQNEYVTTVCDKTLPDTIGLKGYYEAGKQYNIYKLLAYKLLNVTVNAETPE